MGDKEKKEQNNSNHSTRKKLTISQKNALIEWLAEGYDSREVAEKIKDKYGIYYTRQSVEHYLDNHKDEIINKRQELNYNIKERIPLANKGIRVSKLAEVAGKALKTNDFQEFRLYMKLIAEEMGDLQDNIIIKGEVQGLIGQLVTIIQHEVKDEETIKRIAEKLQGADISG
ncbi:MAG: hypothetical protein ACOCRK_01555 [bacterium]